MYGMMYGMRKTTVYLPDELKAALTRTARATGRSEAELIREGVSRVTANDAPRPTAPLFNSGQPDLASANAVLKRYAGLNIGLADASIVVLAERHGVRDVLTLDERHFRALRAGRKRFRLLPADA